MAEEWTPEWMEQARCGHPCFHFFLGECTNGATCNYSHKEIFKAQLGNISKTASKEAVETELRSFNPVHIAYTGNPSQCNFGRGCGIVGFYTLTDLALAVKTTRNSTSEKVKVTIEVHTCLHCDCPMRFSSGGAPLYKSSNVTGTRKEPKLIASPAAGDFDCGECRTGAKKVNSSVQPRALKQGEVIW